MHKGAASFHLFKTFDAAGRDSSCIDRRPENDEIKAAEIGFRNFDVACDIECLDGDTRQFPDGRNRFLRVSPSEKK